MMVQILIFNYIIFKILFLLSNGLSTLIAGEKKLYAIISFLSGVKVFSLYFISLKGEIKSFPNVFNLSGEDSLLYYIKLFSLHYTHLTLILFIFFF